MLKNRLSESTSPYLLQHTDNPVAWQMWGPEALALAKAEGKPILLSIGYAACHWCHVMAHESFENPAIAEVMNTLFVNIKLDREERPDIDAIYMNALQLLGVPGGWPLTMFLTPEGEPFWGGTYFPPEPRQGHPGFIEVLRAVHRTYTEQPEAIEKNRYALREALSAMARGIGAERLSPDAPLAFATALAGNIDPVNGGLRGAPKFPQTPLLELIWRGFLKTRAPALAHAVTASLDHMAQGGIYDHLGGGFARYSVDERWLVPHFEKMLYDNAALIELLTLIWQETRTSLYAERVAETIGFVLRELRGGEGGFAASLDADSEGEEGRFYVWSAAEIVTLLGREAPAFCSAYDVTEEGNFEGHTILNRLKTIEPLGVEAEARFMRNRATLFEARSKRVRPGFDGKVLSDWNGLMIAGLVKAGLAFGRVDWIQEAEAAFDAVLRLLSFEKAGALRLRQSYRAGQSQHDAVSDGYANLARAGLLLEEATGQRRFGETASRLAASLDQYFWDDVSGGYFYSASDAEGLIVRSRFCHDHPLPNANGVMVEVLTRLYHRSGEPRYRERTDALLAAFAGETDKSPISHATYLNGLSFAQSALQIVIRGTPGAQDTRGLRDAASSLPDPEKIVTVIGPDDPLPASHPAAGKSMSDGRAIAYVCRGTRCSLPVQDPFALATAVTALG